MSELGKKRNQIGLWPNHLRTSTSAAFPTKVSSSQIFPSGRAAITTALQQLGLQRHHNVAVAPFSSHCVLSAVGRVATPAGEVGKTTSALLIYEQWGWSFSPESLKKLERIRAKVKLVIDSVDTPYTQETSSGPLSGIADFRVWSLGKTLGGLGGGLLTSRDGSLCIATPGNARTLQLTSELLQRLAKVGIDPVNFFREHSRLPPLDIVEMAARGTLESVLREEQSGRRDRAAIVLRAGLGSLWPEWMIKFLEGGGAPGIVPLGFGWQPTHLQEIRDEIRLAFGVETALYHFNSCGDPLSPDFRMCLAIPTHSQVPEDVLEKVLDLIVKRS